MEEKLSLNSYSFSAQNDEEPILIDSLVVYQNEKSILENKFEAMPESITDDLDLYESIKADMNKFEYNERTKLNVYNEYLSLLRQEGKAVSVSFDGVDLLHESGYPIVNLNVPSKNGFIFKHWVDDSTGRILSPQDIIVNSAKFSSVWEKEVLEEEQPKDDNSELDNLNPPSDEVETDETLPSTGLSSNGLTGYLFLIALGIYFLYKKKSSININ